MLPSPNRYFFGVHTHKHKTSNKGRKEGLIILTSYYCSVFHSFFHCFLLSFPPFFVLQNQLCEYKVFPKILQQFSKSLLTSSFLSHRLLFAKLQSSSLSRVTVSFCLTCLFVPLLMRLSINPFAPKGMRCVLFYLCFSIFPFQKITFFVLTLQPFQSLLRPRAS